jgi:hypothetical protein
MITFVVQISLQTRSGVARTTTLPAKSFRDAQTIVEMLQHDPHRICEVCVSGYNKAGKSTVIPVDLLVDLYTRFMDEVTDPGMPPKPEDWDDAGDRVENIEDHRAREA